MSFWRKWWRRLRRRIRGRELPLQSVTQPTQQVVSAAVDRTPHVGEPVYSTPEGVPAQKEAKKKSIPGDGKAMDVSRGQDDSLVAPAANMDTRLPNRAEQAIPASLHAVVDSISGVYTDPAHGPPTVNQGHGDLQMDSPSVLERLSKQASYTVNLNGQVALVEGTSPVRGSSSLVYEGILRQDAEEVKVAVKVFHSAPPGDMTTLKRILREVHICSKLHHENIIRTLGISTDFGATISIISRWMEMGDAHTFVQNTDHDPRPLLLDIAAGLNYLHTLQPGPVFHGDLKGFNVLVSDEHSAVLANFGLSDLTESSFSMSVVTPQRGSFPWMAPEFLDNYGASAAGDVWAFGMTVLELFTRTAPYPEHPHITNVMCRIMLGSLPSQPTKESTCFRMTDVWWDICISCWKREPSSRPMISDILNKIRAIEHSEPPDIESNTFSLLKEVFDRAVKYSMNLNGQVRLDKGQESLQGSRALVRQGILTQDEGQRRVTVKTPRLTSAGDLNTLKCILREVHILSKLHHENIVGLLGITTDFGPTISIVSQCIGVEDALTYVQDNENDPQPLLLDIAAGLCYLHSHEQGICHGDLKGSNVLVSADRRAYITEFSLSTLTISSLSMPRDVNAPQRNSFVWMAPEILNGGDVSYASDVWAFGMTVLELFTRLPPYHDCADLQKCMRKITTGKLPNRPSEESTCHRMTDAWWGIFSSCCTHEPSSRPPMPEILHKLKEMMPVAPAPKLENDIISILKEASRTATAYSLNLNGQVRLDEEKAFFRGGFASVRKGILCSDSKEIKVAMKTFRDSPSDVKTLKQILREVHICSKLHHDHIVRMLGVSTDFDCTISIISEWMEMGNAHLYVQNVENDPRPLLLDIASALHYLHKREAGPIFHGDLKGANILVSGDRRALLCDFGLSTLTQSSFSMSAPTVRTGGSLPWMAPELLDDNATSAASDIWSFGMTALELFTRSKPFHECVSVTGLISRIIGGKLPGRPDEDATCSRMTDAWWELCLSCWERERALRPEISKVLKTIQTTMSHMQLDTICFDTCEPDTSYSAHV